MISEVLYVLLVYKTVIATSLIASDSYKGALNTAIFQYRIRITDATKDVQ